MGSRKPLHILRVVDRRFCWKRTAWVVDIWWWVPFLSTRWEGNALDAITCATNNGDEMMQLMRDLRQAFLCGITRFRGLRWQHKRRKQIRDEFGDFK
jgi:hypothetical protein